MIELVSSIIFIGSLAGASFIFSKKMPQAMRLAPISDQIKSAGNFFASFKAALIARFKNHPRFKDFTWIDFLQKQLLKARVLVLKAENKINDYMVKLRQKAEKQQENRQIAADNYWRDLKTIIKTKKVSLDRKNSGKNAIETETLSDKNVIAETIFENKKNEPLVGRIVFPETTQKPERYEHPKKNHGKRKKKSNDPFRW